MYLLEVSDPLAAGHLYLFQVVNYQFIILHVKVGLIHVINRVVSRCRDFCKPNAELLTKLKCKHDEQIQELKMG